MLTGRARATWYRGDGMTETTAIVVSIVGTGIGIIGVMGLMLRILTTNISKQFETNAAQMREMKADLTARIDDTNRRFESLTSEMHQRFDRVHHALAENRERMAKLEGSLDGFLAGRRDRDAA